MLNKMSIQIFLIAESIVAYLTTEIKIEKLIKKKKINVTINLQINFRLINNKNGNNMFDFSPANSTSDTSNSLI